MQLFTPIEYLKIDIASNFGLEKELWETRLKWFDDNEAYLAPVPTLTKAELRRHTLMSQADEPALFYAGICAWLKARDGKAIGYPVSLDATASGAQLLSVMIGCKKSASLCNVIDTGDREDLYTNVYQGMKTRLDDSGDVTQKDAKQAVMTSLYGSTAEPRRVFGEDAQLDAFFDTMEQDATGIWELTKSMIDLWQPDALSHDWVLPDNFHVKTKVMGHREEWIQWLNAPVQVTTKVNQAQETGLALCANITHSVDGMIVREMSARCSYSVDMLMKLMVALGQPVPSRATTIRPQDDLVAALWSHYERTNFLSARILDSLDAENLHLVDIDVIKTLIGTLPDKPFPIMAVHDCFRVHPNYGNDIRKQYNRILSDLAGSNILQDVASQILGHDVEVTKYDDFASDILEANYALS